MTVRKITKKKVSRSKLSKRKSNPGVVDWILGRKRTSIEGGISTIECIDGVLIIRGDRVATSYPELDALLGKQQKNLKIEFEPHNSKKRYILNKPIASNDNELDDGASDAEERFRRMGPRGRGRIK